jgi:excisionase family DNA binding protein
MARGGGALLTVRDVAAQLGVYTATVYRLGGDGQLPHVRVLNAIRVAPRDLVAFVEGHEATRPSSLTPSWLAHEDRRWRAEEAQLRELERRNEREQKNFETIMAAMNSTTGQSGSK